jgi:TetR/AcrR family transcriptional regulator
MRGVERRQHFINAALGLFSTSGFRGTSTRAIAEAAGVSEALLFRHFPTKADLYAAILQQKARETGFSAHLETLRALARRGDDWAFVQYIVQLILASYQRDPDFERLMLYAALEGHELAKASRQLFGMPTLALLRDFVIDRQRTGVFRPGDPTLIVFGLVALPVYFSMAQRLLGAQLTDVSDKTAANCFTRLVLDGARVHGNDIHRSKGRASAGRARRRAASSAQRRRAAK